MKGTGGQESVKSPLRGPRLRCFCRAPAGSRGPGYTSFYGARVQGTAVVLAAQAGTSGFMAEAQGVAQQDEVFLDLRGHGGPRAAKGNADPGERGHRGQRGSSALGLVGPGQRQASRA